MWDTSRGLLYLPIICLSWTGVKGHVLASLAPPVHLSGERLGWTLLVCMVRDFRRGRLEVSWTSPSVDQHTSLLDSFAVNRQLHEHSAVSAITVTTNDWPSFSCSVNYPRHPRVQKKGRTVLSGDELCSGEQDEEDVVKMTNIMSILILRLLLFKSLVFNTLITLYAVIKCLILRRTQ